MNRRLVDSDSAWILTTGAQNVFERLTRIAGDHRGGLWRRVSLSLASAKQAQRKEQVRRYG